MDDASDPDLEHYAQTVIPDRPIKVVLHELTHPIRNTAPVLHLIFCGDGNDAWTSAQVLNSRGVDAIDLADATEPKQRETTMARARRMVAECGVVRVDCVYDKAGAEVDPLAKGTARALMAKIPDFVFSRVFSIATSPTSFPRRHIDDQPVVPAAELAPKS